MSTKTRDELQILHMQVRKDDISRKRECEEFATHTGLKPEQFTVWNVFDDPYFDVVDIRHYDALMIGGSSDDPPDSPILTEEEYPFIKSAFPLLQYCLEHRIPVFAACMGFLLSLQVFDAEIMIDIPNMEKGIVPIYLTDAGRRDPLLHDIPDGFHAVSFHKKRAVALPEGAILLAKSDLCSIHGFTFGDKPFYAFQFHPELSDDALVKLLFEYKDRYPGGQEAYDEIIATRQPTADANFLMRKFVDRIILG